MNINLDNYESFFLMYVDNELSAPERKSVEEFMAEYPYLQEEMNLLKETVLAPEVSHFDFKAGLLKPVMSEESLQENILLHLDDELVGSAKQDLEKMLLTDEKLQEEWSLLKKTQLDPAEAILFPDIKSLYRYEKGRLVIGRFARWAVAAAVIAGGFFIAVTVFNNQSPNTVGIASTDSIKTGTNQVDNKNNELVKGTKVQPTIEKVKLPAVEDNENPVADNNNMAGQLPAINKTKNEQPVKQLEIAVTNSKKQPGVKALADDINAPVIEPVLKGNDIARINQPPMNEPGKGTAHIAARPKSEMHTDTNIQPVENLFARNASLEDEEDISDNHIFMMDEEKFARTKAAGFLKKIKRTVERTTKIKPGHSLKIAGFEFAVK